MKITLIIHQNLITTQSNKAKTNINHKPQQLKNTTTTQLDSSKKSAQIHVILNKKNPNYGSYK